MMRPVVGWWLFFQLGHLGIWDIRLFAETFCGGCDVLWLEQDNKVACTRHIPLVILASKKKTWLDLLNI